MDELVVYMAPALLGTGAPLLWNSAGRYGGQGAAADSGCAQRSGRTGVSPPGPRERRPAIVEPKAPMFTGIIQAVGTVVGHAARRR